MSDEKKIALSDIANNIAKRVEKNYGTTVMYDASWIVEDELKALQPEQKWQTIDTAPRDGTPVILLYRDGNKVSVGWWSGNEQIGWGNNFANNMNVSHFIPLPEPPEKI